MPPLPPTSMATRKRTRSTNISENNLEHQHTTSLHTISTTATATSVHNSSLPTNTVVVNAPPKRQRNNPPPTLSGPPPPIAPRTSYSFRNRSLTPDPRHSLTRFPSLHAPSSGSPNRQRYNLRPRRPQSQVRLPQVPTQHPLIPPRRIRRPIPPIAQTASSSTNAIQPPSVPLQPSAPLPPPVSAPVPPVIPPVTLPTPPVIQPRQYRLVYISDDDEESPAQGTATVVNTTFNLVTDDEDDELTRPQVAHRRTSRTTSGAALNTR